jgi:uroporphyrin-III C-methyltransferase / precorrin-2 dehydrogenase / sirohydrochlorin ferrochelatase
MAAEPLLPVFLKLKGRSVLLVGGGAVATEKLAVLRRAGARVTVVSPEVTAAIAKSRVRILRRAFRASDLKGQWFVVSAATPEVNRAVSRAAARARVFVNAVDDPANATVYLGGVVRRDGVTVAISTNGDAPALAGLLREGLDELLPEDIGRWMSEARRARKRWRANGTPMRARRPELLRALTRLYASRAAEPVQ